MKKSTKPLPPLAEGQLWKTDSKYIHIIELGKTLVDYKMMERLGQMARTQTTAIDTMENYLKIHNAVLVHGSPA
jgi:hypothetical protein